VLIARSPRRMVGWWVVGATLAGAAIEWSGGSIINLGNPAGSNSSTAFAINNAGQIVGWSDYNSNGGAIFATVWSGGNAIELGSLPGANVNLALGINDIGQVVGFSGPVSDVPEPSTWAMRLVGFAGLGLAGYRRAKTGHATLALSPVGA
jgi:probable HAF family extracellular repeat protein